MNFLSMQEKIVIFVFFSLLVLRFMLVPWNSHHITNNVAYNCTHQILPFKSHKSSLFYSSGKKWNKENFKETQKDEIEEKNTKTPKSNSTNESKKKILWVEKTSGKSFRNTIKAHFGCNNVQINFKDGENFTFEPKI